ncbi:MAG: class C sortase [Firmicutes bacterium]|nr:class C sortase [Bacillota bacterium]
MKKHLPTIIVVIIFLCGLSLFLYPVASNMYNNYMNEKNVTGYRETITNVPSGNHEEEWKEAKLYNKHLNDKEKLKQLKIEYDHVLNIMGDGAMGYIEIPKISVTLMIYHTVDEDNLQDGLGHVEGTHLPIGGKSTHSILAGHTGLPSAKLLTNLDRMQIGDKFYINVLGEELEYKVDNIAVVLPEDTSLTQVEKDKDLVTLVTCTPYGINSHRLLVRGIRNDGKGSDTIKEGVVDIEGDVVNIQMRYMITCTLTGLVLIFIAVYGFISIIRKRRKGGE